MEIQKQWKAYRITARSACLTMLWVVLAGVSVRQCEMGRMERSIRDLEKRIHRIENRPAVQVVVDDGKAELDGDD